MRFHRRDEYYASTDDGRFIICRVLVRDRELFEAWRVNEMIGHIEVNGDRSEAWKQAIALCKNKS